MRGALLRLGLKNGFLLWLLLLIKSTNNGKSEILISESFFP